MSYIFFACIYIKWFELDCRVQGGHCVSYPMKPSKNDDCKIEKLWAVECDQEHDMCAKFSVECENAPKMRKVEKVEKEINSSEESLEHSNSTLGNGTATETRRRKGSCRTTVRKQRRRQSSRRVPMGKMIVSPEVKQNC